MDIAEIVSLPADSRKHMISHGQRFRTFLTEENLQRNLQTIPNSVLNQYIRYFYFKLKKIDGEPYSPASLVCIRAGLQRYLRMIEKLTVDIINGEDFSSANSMLRVKVRDFHQSGGRTQQFEPIEEGDMRKLMIYFQGSTAEVEQDKFLFYIIYSFGERGQEHLKFLKDRSSLQLHVDSDGKPYYCLPPLPSKNKSADPEKAKKQPDNKQARIYDVEKVEKYLKLLPVTTKDNNLFPRPLASRNDGGPVFSSKQNRGENYLSGFMRNLSTKAGLAKTYTNHCIRVTRICDLEAAGHSMSDIMSITGQLSERKTRRYLAKRRDRSLQKTSESVHMNRHDLEQEAGPPEHADAVEIVGETAVSTEVSVSTEAAYSVGTKFAFNNCTFHGCSFN